MRIHKYSLTATLLLCSLFFWVPDLLAQSGGFAGSFSRMGFSPRGMAMGNTMTAVHHDGSYGYYNPALAAAPADGVQFDLGTAALRFDRQLHMLTSHFQLPPSAGFSVSLINARVSDIDGRSSSGYHTEMLTTSEYQVIGNFGLRFSDRFWGGIGIKYNLANLHDEIPNTSSIGLDAGVYIQPLSVWTLAFAVKDLLSSYSVDSSDLYGTDTAPRIYDFPTRLIAGTSYQLSELWLISFDFETRLQQSEINRLVSDHNGAGERMVRQDISSITRFARLGTRYLIHERITLRGGLQLNQPGDENQLQPSAGFSLHLPYDRFSPSIDYAFMREPSQLSTMHVFAIRLNI
jgi:hypothetical protein